MEGSREVKQPPLSIWRMCGGNIKQAVCTNSRHDVREGGEDAKGSSYCIAKGTTIVKSPLSVLRCDPECWMDVSSPSPLNSTKRSGWSENLSSSLTCELGMKCGKHSVYAKRVGGKAWTANMSFACGSGAYPRR